MQYQSDCRLWNYFGAHPCTESEQEGYRFRVWAPNAQQVSLMGDFNGWNTDSHPMNHIGHGVWELFLPGLKVYDAYKYVIHTHDGRVLAKADPYAFHAETRPGNASKLMSFFLSCVAVLSVSLSVIISSINFIF